MTHPFRTYSYWAIIAVVIWIGLMTGMNLEVHFDKWLFNKAFTDTHSAASICMKETYMHGLDTL